ncbi:glycosyltransferase [bacterium]|nr:glycosyltransferase [bacterium]
MSGTPLVSVMLVNHNGERDLEGCIHSLLEEVRDVGEVEIILVDNASTDRSLQLVPSDPRITVLPQRTNLGFAEGNNAAARAARGEWLVGVNLDTRGRPGWLSQLLSASARHPHAGAYSCRLLSAQTGQDDFVSGFINFEGYGFESREPLSDGAEILFPTGAGFMLRRSLWEEVGGMDAGFFLFFEDIDLGWRLNLLGRPVVHVKDAVLSHRKHGAVDALGKARRMRYYRRNALMMILKNYAEEKLAPLLSASLLLLAARRAILDPSQPPLFRGELDRIDPLRELGGRMREVLAAREWVQSRRVIGDQDIFRRFFPNPLRTWAFDDEDYARLDAAGYPDQKAAVLRALGVEAIFPQPWVA